MLLPLESNRALFLDRDGVINKVCIRDGKSYPPATLNEFVFIEGVRDALILSKQMGFLNIIVTNQPDVGTGVQTAAVLAEMHDLIKTDLTVDDIFVCTHSEDNQCGCRKPLPGMLISAAKKWNIDLQSSYLVGDRWRDIGAAQAAGCASFFIDYGYREQRPNQPYQTVHSLYEAVQMIYKTTTMKEEKRWVQA